MEEYRTDPLRANSGRSFILTAVVYVFGILAFSTWSYFEHQTTLEQHAELRAPEKQRHINRVALVEGAETIFLLLVSIPLIMFYRHTRAHSTSQVAELNNRLKKDNEKLVQHEKELENAIHDLERFNAVATGRELRIIELKSEVNALLEELDRPGRYNTAPSQGTNE